MRRHPFLIALVILIVGTTGLSLAADAGWPGLRGPDYDGAVRTAKLVGADGKGALSLGWKKSLGSGYSMPAAADGRIIAMFSSGDGDFAAAFKPDNGDELWRYRIADLYKGHDGSHDGPLSSPLIAGGRVYGLSPRGQLFALDAATGKAIWSKDLVKEQGAKTPFYGFTTSPILVGGALIVQMGAGAGKSIGGFRPEDGSLIWSAGDDSVNYQTPIAATLGGKLQVLAAGDTTLVGLDPAGGKVLWSHPHKGDQSATGGQSIVPVPAGEGRFLLRNKNDSSTMLKVAAGPAGAWEITELWTKNSIRGNYIIPVYHDGYLYGMSGFILTCVDAATGEPQWKSREPGDGFLTLVGGHLVIISKPGALRVAAASPAGYQEVARMDLFSEHAWSAVAYADGHLYARSMAHLARVDVVAPAAAPQTIAGGSWVEGTGFGRFLSEAGKASDKSSVIDKYLAQWKSLPIVEDSGAVHFVYRGEAKDVALVGDLIGSEREDPMSRLEGTDLYHYSARLEPDAAITYGFVVDYGEPAADPRNPRKANGLSGDVSLLVMPGWQEPAPAGAVDAARQGKLETLEITTRSGAEGKEKKRTAQIYLPAGYDAQKERRYPTLYVPDGKDALEKGGMKETLDRLMDTSLEPLIAIFIMPDPEASWELWNVDPYVQMVVDDLLPAIDAKYRTEPLAARRAIAGAGGGGSAALIGALTHPDKFVRVGSQSPFIFDRAQYVDQVKDAEKQPLVMYLGWGTYDMRSTREAWDTAQGNRALWSYLRERGYRPAGGEAHEGFGWSFWRGHTGEMLAALFPARKE